MLDAHKRFPVLIGTSLMDAIPLTKSHGFVFRIINENSNKDRDKESVFDPYRVNITVDSGIVVSYTFG